jgi:hypothetical protein
MAETWTDTQESPAPPEQRKGWGLMVFCARRTRTIKLCSSHARSGRSINPHP